MRGLVLLVLVVLGALALAERIPTLRERLPWLPAIPGLAATAQKPADAGAESGDQAGGGRRGGGRQRAGADGPVPVLVAPVRFADMPVTADVLGTVQATNMVTVRSQVDGRIIEIAFKDGQDVRKGDLVARIDPATYQAQYDQAVAKKAQDEAQLANAQVDLVRYQKLAETQYGSHQQADTQKAQVAQYTGQVQQDLASVNSAKAILDYTTIRSPLDGRTGIRLIDAGNIVHASDAAGIVTVAEIRPIAAIFNLPQQWLRQVNSAAAKGPLRLEARDGETGAILDSGTLQVVDNAVDATTGTVKLKGSFPNADGQLWPGQFVNLRLYVDTLKNVPVVPTPAVQRGPDGAFVYVVKNDKAILTKLTPGRQTETETVVADGLLPPADVVTTGFTRLTDGAPVAIGPGAAKLSADGAPSPRPPRSPGNPAPSAEAAGEPAPKADGKAAPDTSGPEAIKHRRHGDRAQGGGAN